MLRKVLVFILAASLLACKPEIKASALYLGDSLMVNSASLIASVNTAYGRSALTMFEVLGGASIEHSEYFAARLENVQSLVDLDMVFISLGTNVYHDNQDISQNIADILNAISPRARIYWVLPHSNVRNARKSKPYDATIEALNSASKSGAWPNLTLLSLDEYALSKNISMVDSWIGPDGVHLSPEGIYAWTDILYLQQKEFDISSTDGLVN